MNTIRLIRQVLIVTTLMLTLTFANGVSAMALEPIATANTNLGEQIKATTEKASGKVQETIGNITGDRQTQIEGKVKQAEGNIRAVPSDFGGHKTDRLSESEIAGKTQQAESNILRYHARD